MILEKIKDQDSGFKVQGSRFKIQGSRCSRFRIQEVRKPLGVLPGS
jgi:hypothetical protein